MPSESSSSQPEALRGSSGGGSKPWSLVGSDDVGICGSMKLINEWVDLV